MPHSCHCLKQGPPALLSANSAIRKEAMGIYYEENNFAFYDSALTVKWVDVFAEQIGQYAKKLRKLSIRRSVAIGDMKSRVEIYFTAEINEHNTAIVLRRPVYTPVVYVPGKVGLIT